MESRCVSVCPAASLLGTSELSWSTLQRNYEELVVTVPDLQSAQKWKKHICNKCGQFGCLNLLKGFLCLSYCIVFLEVFPREQKLSFKLYSGILPLLIDNYHHCIFIFRFFFSVYSGKTPEWKFLPTLCLKQSTKKTPAGAAGVLETLSLTPKTSILYTLTAVFVETFQHTPLHT